MGQDGPCLVREWSVRIARAIPGVPLDWNLYRMLELSVRCVTRATRPCLGLGLGLGPQHLTNTAVDTVIRSLVQLNLRT